MSNQLPMAINPSKTSKEHVLENLLNCFTFVDVEKQLVIAYPVFLHLGYTKESVHAALSKPMLLQYTNCKGFAPREDFYISISQIGELIVNAPRDKYIPHILEFVKNTLIPLFNTQPQIKHDDLKENTIMTTNQLINIQQQTIGNDAVNAVSARELHKFLESKRQFTNWVEPYIKADNEYGFTDGVDFIAVNVGVNRVNQQVMIDYWFTLDMAKEVSMLSKTEKGKQARKYFIECEKKAQNPQPAEVGYSSALALLGVPEQIVPVIAKVYEERDEAVKHRHHLDDRRAATAMSTAGKLAIENKKLKAQLNKSTDYATIRTVEKFVKGVVLKWRALKKYCDEKKLPILNVEDPLYGSVKSYPAEAWDKVYGVKLTDIIRGT